TGVHRRGDVTRERPRSGRPHKKIFARPSTKREADEHGPMRYALVALVHFHLTDPDGTAWAPRHRIMGAVNQSPIVAFSEETPDRIVVFLRHRVIAAALVWRLAPVLFAVPIHPVTKPNRLLCLDTSKFIYPLLAERDESVDAGETIPRN